jgi:hypothetical protein
VVDEVGLPGVRHLGDRPPGRVEAGVVEAGGHVVRPIVDLQVPAAVEGGHVRVGGVALVQVGDRAAGVRVRPQVGVRRLLALTGHLRVVQVAVDVGDGFRPARRVGRHGAHRTHREQGERQRGRDDDAEA